MEEAPTFKSRQEAIKYLNKIRHESADFYDKYMKRNILASKIEAALQFFPDESNSNLKMKVEEEFINSLMYFDLSPKSHSTTKQPSSKGFYVREVEKYLKENDQPRHVREIWDHVQKVYGKGSVDVDAIKTFLKRSNKKPDHPIKRDPNRVGYYLYSEAKR